MKILEAWARGVPVVATQEAVRGLDGGGEPGFLLAADGPGFAAAVEEIHRRPGLARRLVATGRAKLADRHDPERTTAVLEATYRDVLATR
jgi:glycosyltransferase involved in cell wall biosynthesis